MTKLLYLEDWNQLTGTATVTESTTYQDKPALILDQTIFYPQGGGQPYDTGTITALTPGGAGQGPQGAFRVEQVRFDNGIVYHLGQFVSGTIAAGETVSCSVDAERRILHSRLHSGGHVLDMAILALGLPWTPGKGYHFPEGPYIEYAGNLEGLDKEKLKGELEAECNKFVTENRQTSIRFMPKEKMHEVCHHVPDYLPEGKPARVVMYGDFGVPCGGTHVNALGEIGHMTIRKIKQEGQKIKIGYDVAR